jgi:OFA family oxalate/formate antiporter-like MFS transporter
LRHARGARQPGDALFGAVGGGTGGGAVYATSVGHAVKWFPDRRGLAVGLTAAGYDAGAALTVIPIRYVIATSGYQAAFFWFGLVQGVVVFALAWFLRGPDPDEIASTTPPKVIQSARSYTPVEVLRSPVFWLLYIMFVMVSGSGLMATAQIAPIAKDFGVADTVILFGATTITIALRYKTTLACPVDKTFPIKIVNDLSLIDDVVA